MERRARTGGWTVLGAQALPVEAFDRARVRVLAGLYLAAPPTVAVAAWLSPKAFPVADHAALAVGVCLTLTPVGMLLVAARHRLGERGFLVGWWLWLAVALVFVGQVQPPGSPVGGEWGALPLVLLIATFAQRRRDALAGLLGGMGVMVWLVHARLGPVGSSAIVLIIDLWVTAACAVGVRVLREVAASALDAAHRGEITDPLTGLMNRRGMERLGGQVWDRRGAARRPIALLVVDIDHFKQVNDTLGHAAGDAVLSRVAAVLSSSLREGDVLARLGGEEFLVLLPATAEEATEVAQRLRERVAEVVEQVTVSIGVTATVPSPVDPLPESLWRHVQVADDALYRAKSTGRNCVVTAA